MWSSTKLRIRRAACAAERETFRLDGTGFPPDTIVKLMDDPDEDVRAMALMAGATLERPETVPHVIRMLDDEDWWIRMIATETLGNIGDARAVEPLISAPKLASSAWLIMPSGKWKVSNAPESSAARTMPEPPWST